MSRGNGVYVWEYLNRYKITQNIQAVRKIIGRKMMALAQSSPPLVFSEIKQGTRNSLLFILINENQTVWG